MLFTVIFSMESLEKCKNSDLAASSSNNFFEPRQMLMHEKTCMITIIKGEEIATFPSPILLHFLNRNYAGQNNYI